MTVIRYGRKTVSCECALCGMTYFALPSEVKRGRQYCSRACSGIAERAESHYAWKGADAGVQAKRHRVRAVVALGDCERCGRPAADRVPRDGDRDNLASDNIACLCRRCRMEADGNMDRVRAMGRRPKPKMPPAECPECGRLKKLLTSGVCHACTERQRRIWHAEIKGRPCAVCGSFVNVQAHHIIARAELRDRGRLDLMWDTRNRLPLCAEPAPNRCHNRHTHAVQRVPRHVLPPAAWSFADEIGLSWYLERFYPDLTSGAAAERLHNGAVESRKRPPQEAA